MKEEIGILDDDTVGLGKSGEAAFAAVTTKGVENAEDDK